MDAKDTWIILGVSESVILTLLTCGYLQIIRRANENGENPLDLSNRFCQEYLTDMANLQCLPPTHQPRVSDHMEQIKDMITQVSSFNSISATFILEGFNKS